ncbi:MAG: cobaltochelatase subunit CobN [Acidimicrobiales bacterium]
MTLLVLTTADTEILALRSVIESLPEGFPAVRAANPVGLAPGEPGLDGVELVLVRLLGGRSAWEAGFDDLAGRCSRLGIPLVALGGEAVPDADLAARSTVSAATVAASSEYLSQGGLANTEHLLRFLADTVLVGGWGFDAPATVPDTGVWGGDERMREVMGEKAADRPVIGVVFYRAHVLSGNTLFVDALVGAIERRGGVALPVWCYSLRQGAAEVAEVFSTAGATAVITTVLAAGGDAGSARGDWDPGPLGTLGVPVIQAICATGSAEEWRGNDSGLSPLDVAMAVAIPEFDGRIISAPISTKEVVDDGDTLGWPVLAYRPLPDRVERVAGLAVRLGMLASTPPAERKVAVVLSAYPTKRARIGNAVALDTPASVVALLHRLRAEGYRVDRIPADGDALMAELADGLTYDQERLTPLQMSAAVGRWSAESYVGWWNSDAVPAQARERVEATWGTAPGVVHTDDLGALCFAGLDLGGVLVAVQPPRGYGEDPIAVYHSPDLAPTHHYLAFYRWLDLAWGAQAVVHAGKHGTLEWLPGKGVGLSADCFPDLALGDLPLIYPFVVNDPGEGTQAKRRAHAVIVDHLLPPMTRAETYDDLARLEALLDEYAQVSSLDPHKLPAIREQVWELLVRAELHRDLGLTDRPPDEEFDATLLHVDGYLCELKDAQIRGGLHILGAAPVGEAELDMVTALTRLAQGEVPSLRETVATELGVDLGEPGAQRRTDVDAVEAECRRRLGALQAVGWEADAGRATGDPTLAWVCTRLMPALGRTDQEITSIVDGLFGRAVAPGPSGAPTRGMAHVLPTGRNFYSVDPKAVPSRLAWDVGCKLAAAVCERHLSEEGRLPETVGIVMWGTAAMRTAGDDVAEALALLGVRPVWAAESPRVVGLEAIPLHLLGRPRIDVTVRISGFFRDAFPHLVHMIDDAVGLVAGLDESVADNFVRAHDVETGAAEPDPRIFGAKPGAYGSGILGVIESRNWRTDDDLAAVYQAWSGWSYGRRGMGSPAGPAMGRRFAAIEVAVKNQDNREHDIFDSDDYLQDHGGMVATIRALRRDGGLGPAKAWFGDSADPANPRVRSLAEEAARVVRTRVVNPKWLTAMQRHGYKGAFEMAATVDYLFGYDATAHVVEDWMYERVTEAYVADAGMRKFFEQSNPWALRNIAERLLEAVERGMWEAPSHEALRALRAAVLESEGWEEGRA